MQELIKNRLLSIFAFISIILSVIIVAQTPSTITYEISIYNIYPWYFWLFLTFPIIILFYKIIFYELNQEGHKFIKYDMIISIIAAIMTISIFLLLPFFRDYYFYSGGDPISHLTLVTYMAINGHFSSDVYPIIHIIIYIFSTFTGVSARRIMFFIPLIFNIFFIITMYLLSKSLKLNNKESLFVILLSIIPMFGAELLYVAPSIEAFFLVPITLFIVIKSRFNLRNSMHYSILLLILFIFFVFFHPETTFFLLIILLCFNSPIAIKRIISQRNYSFQNKIFLNIKSVLTPLLFLLISFFLWFSTTITFGNTVQTAYNSLILNLGISQIATYAETAGRVHMQLSQLFDLLIKIYGPTLIYTMISTIFVGTVLFNVVFRRRINARNLLLSILFIVLVFFSFLFLFKDLLIGGRPIKFLILTSTIIVSIFFNQILTKYKNSNYLKKIPLIIITFLILAAIGISFMTTYPSPIINKYNYEVMQSDFSGMDFFFTKKDQTLFTLTINIELLRYAEYVSIDHQDSKILHIPSKLPPNHFGYDDGKKLGDFYEEDTYMVFNSLTEKFYPEVFPQYKDSWKFTPQDFSNIKEDKTVNLVYDNSNVKVFEILGRKS